MAQPPRIGPELFRFLRELKENNERHWFQANKKRYESEVRDPLLRFVAAFAGPLGKISPHLLADPRPSGGSLFRIYRDTRFSRDKSPYKTWAALRFSHEQAKDVHAPGYYLHLEPGGVFAGAGLWHPDPSAQKKVRDAIVAESGKWKRVVSGAAFRKSWRFGGDSLRRAPRGYPDDHPLIGDLKRKDFITVAGFTMKQASAPDFLDRFAATCRTAAPFVEFLTRAVGLPW
jgi:uncharacterized protein (TIGR02453 family)